MKNHCSLRAVRTYAVLVGSMDFVTGLALVAAPAFTLARMGAAVPGAEALSYVRFSGAFVAAVGASYLIALLPLRRRAPARRAQSESLLGYTLTSVAAGTAKRAEGEAGGGRGAGRLRGALEFTLVARVAAGGFAAGAVATGLFDVAWLMVAATDLACVGAQGWMLWKGIPEDE